MAMAKRTGKSERRRRAHGGKVAATACTTLEVTRRDAVAWVLLNRPEVRNAFNATLIAELTALLRALDADPSVRAVVLAGAGSSFCAGADLNWMQQMAAFSPKQNLADAGALAAMLSTLDLLSKPTIAR